MKANEARLSTRKRLAPGRHASALLIWCLLNWAASAADANHGLRLELVPRFGTRPLIFDALAYTNSAGQALSVTRLDLLLSGFAMRRGDGRWLNLTNAYVYICGRDQRTTFRLPQLPSGKYDRFRLVVGVSAAENHANPAMFGPEHPLNPNVNGLHWNWQGGYVFVALEGAWRTRSGLEKGYSFHLATDRLLTELEFPLQLDLMADTELHVTLDVQRLVASPEGQGLNDDSDTTHSRPGDARALRLRENLKRAFSIEGVRSVPPLSSAAGGNARVEIAAGARPYRLKMSRFFPQPSLPRDNPLTEEGVALGRQLFNDPILSGNGTQSCASCHHVESAFTERRRSSVGAEGRQGTRNAMPLFNLAWKRSFFWDGRASTLREQVLQPIQNPDEMHESLTNLLTRLRGKRTSPEYSLLFAQAFGTPEISADRVARALEQFLLVQLSFDSKYDRVLAGAARFTDQEQRGFELFHTEYDPGHGQHGADCFHCHGGSLFQSQSFANNGLDTEYKDPGRSTVTHREGDQGKFAVPSLRNVAVTAPYMHDGRFSTLEEVIRHYCAGVKRSPTLDPNLAKHPNGGVPLSEADQQALVAFLKTLTDERFLPVAAVQ
jgi:cytochrome c peroxidase